MELLAFASFVVFGLESERRALSGLAFVQFYPSGAETFGARAPPGTTLDDLIPGTCREMPPLATIVTDHHDR